MNTWKYLVVLGLNSWLAVAQAAGFVVIDASAAAYSPGTLVASGEIVELKETEWLKLLAESGQVIELQGPIRQSPQSQSAQAGDGLLESLAKVVKAAHSNDLTLAAFRNKRLGEGPPRGDIWGVEVDRGGIWCVRGDQPAVIWWPDAVRGAVLSLENRTRQQTAEVTWSSRARQLAWPSTLPGDGDSVRVAVDLTDRVSDFVVVAVPDELGNDAARSGWMFERGCRTQAMRLLGDVVQRRDAAQQ